MTNNSTNIRNATRTTTPRFYTISEVADLLGVSPRTVRRWIESSDLAVHRFGGAVRISDVDLRAFLAMHREG